MVDQNKKIDDFVEISLSAFKKNDGSIILVASDSTVIPLSDSNGNVILALNDYYTKSQTYSNTQVNALFGNYYTKTQSNNKFVVSGETATGPIIVNDGGTDTANVTEDGFFVFDGTRSSELNIDSIEFHKVSGSGYVPTSYVVSNISGSRIVFETDSSGDFKLRNGSYVNEISNDDTLIDNSDLIVPTQKAVKTYVDSVIVGTIPISGSSSDFNVNGVLTFSNGNTLDGTNTNEIIFVGSTPTDQFDLSFEDSTGDILSGLVFKPLETQIVNASGSPMASFTLNELTLSGGVDSEYIVLSSGQTVYEISSDSFDVTGSYTEDEILPTQSGVRTFVNSTSVTLASGGVIGSGDDTVTINENGITVSDNLNGNSAFYHEYGIDITSMVSPISADAYTVSVTTSAGSADALHITGNGYIALANGPAVNTITTVMGQSSTALPTESAVKSYVDSLAALVVSSNPGTNFTVPVSSGDYYAGCATNSGAFTLTLPLTPATGFRVWVKDETSNASNNNITVDGNGNNIDGSTTFVMSVDKQGKIFVYNGTEWKVF